MFGKSGELDFNFASRKYVDELFLVFKFILDVRRH